MSRPSFSIRADAVGPVSMLAERRGCARWLSGWRSGLLAMSGAGALGAGALGDLAATSGSVAADGGTLLALDRLSVRRGEREVLHEISLRLARGSITALVGPSGIGKSTLLATLNGLLRPVSGRLHSAGIGTLDTPAQLLAHRRRTATVFQEHALIARLSAFDNVLLGLADRRHPLSPLPWPRPLCERALAALAAVGLLARALVPVAQLSGGERQRVGIARALVRDPVLLLADEPFAAIDPALARHMAGEFRRLVRERALTVVVVLHQIELARALADRVIALADGRIAYDGPPADFDAAAQARIFPMPSPLAVPCKE